MCVIIILNPKYNKQKRFHTPSQNHLLEALASESSRAEREFRDATGFSNPGGQL